MNPMGARFRLLKSIAFYVLGAGSTFLGYKFYRDVNEESEKRRQGRNFSGEIVFCGRKKTMKLLSKQTTQAMKGCQNLINSSKTKGKKLIKKIFSRN